MILDPTLLNSIAPLDIKARQIVEGFISGMHRSPFHGFSVEFAEHRPYNPGDDLKHIDWKVYAKRDRLYVKQYEEETNLRCYILMDVSPSMRFRHFADWSKLKYSVHLSAALAYMMHKQRDACSFIPFDQELSGIEPAKSSYSHLRHIYSRMETVLKSDDDKEINRRKTATANVIHEVAERVNRRSLIIILSDLFENVQQHEELISALKHLRHRSHEVVLFHMLEKRSERELDFPDGRFIFEDLETGSEIDVLPKQIRNDYQKKMAEYTHRFKNICSNARIDYEEVDTESSFNLALLAYLNKRKKMM